MLPVTVQQCVALLPTTNSPSWHSLTTAEKRACNQQQGIEKEALKKRSVRAQLQGSENRFKRCKQWDKQEELFGAVWGDEAE